MKTRVCIMFWQKVHKANAKGLAPISCRITVAGKRVEMSTSIRVLPSEWSDSRKKVLGSSSAARVANAAITKMNDALTDLWADLERQGKPVTAQSLARAYNAGSSTLNLLALFDAFRLERGGLVGVEIAPATIKTATTRYNRLSEFLTAQRLTDLRPEEFTHTVADKFLHWLLREANYKRNSANKVLQTIFQVLRWGVRREYLQKNPMDLYQFKGQALAEIKFLTEGELATLTHLPLPTECLANVRDCFVFQCWTGLAYADLAALNVVRDARYHTDGQGNVRRVLHITRAKSTMQKGYECVIPLLPEAERLLALYADSLPVVANQPYNRGLKELGALAGIEVDKMHSHVGRKTAGTLMLNRGVPLPVVSKFLGHANVLITQKLYAKLLDTTVVDAFSGAFGAAAPAPVVYQLPSAA